MVNKALVLENHIGVMERKCKLVRQHQSGSSSRPHVGPPSAGPVFHPAQPQFQPRPQLAGQGFSIPQHPNNFQTPGARNQNVQRTQAAQNPMPVERKCYACGERGHYTNQCPNPAPALLKQLHLHLHLSMGPTLFLLLLSRTMRVGESTMLLWSKPKKHQTLSLVCFCSCAI
jgi:hypothetical protein